ncbi:hypothetical protein MAPG_04021 [Magnaporthiopsis poae ATCC 64411]|uniref:Allergen Asp f 4 n=1 Tax=Magnaporthiopsis poae (strain ATCC 64411 / 73-15) TaxID=644358 RepID=A0A0C4DVL4_MAGP6|nr:hypothetical protein MAPG_04021 [Magnaporthiopsis poae ATCC 64411]
MHLTSLILLAAAGVSAHPSGHAHMHRHAHAHEKRNPVPEPSPAVGDIVTAEIMGKTVSWKNTYDGKGSPFVKGGNKPKKDDKPTPPPPASTPSPAPTPPADDKNKGDGKGDGKKDDDKKGDDGKGSGVGVGTKTPFCSAGSGSKLNSRATAQQIAYAGNTGVKGNWGCNIMLVADAKTASEYKYTAKFTNQAKDEQVCTCSNKIGPTGLIDGFFHEGTSWNMAPGSTQYVAFDSNTQGACVCNSGKKLRKTEFGQLAGTWLEFDFENASNNGWLGADASALVPQKYGMQVDGLQVCFEGVCSTIWPGGKGDNAYLGGMEDLDGVGLNIRPGPCQLDVKVGYNS